MLGTSSFYLPYMKQDENAYNLPSLLDSDDNKLRDMLSRLQLDAMVGKSGRNDVNTTYGGGRVGYSFPMGDDELTAGVSGGGYSNKYGKDFGVTGADISYQRGKNNFGAEYNQQGLDKLLRLLYTRQF